MHLEPRVTEHKKPMARVLLMGNDRPRRTAPPVAPAAIEIGCPHPGCPHTVSAPTPEWAWAKLEAHLQGKAHENDQPKGAA